MSRDCKTWSFHDKRHPSPPGSPFERGNPPRVSCIRCGEHRLQTGMETDVRIKHQRRCIDRKLCATARGGKS